MSPMAYTSCNPLTAKDSLVLSEPSFSKVTAELSLRYSVAGGTPTPSMTRSASNVVPSFRCTAPTLEESPFEGVAFSTLALILNLTPFFSSRPRKILPTFLPITRSIGSVHSSAGKFHRDQHTHP